LRANPRARDAIESCRVSLALANAEYLLPRFAQPRGQAGEITVAGDQAEPLEATGIEQVHRIDDHRAVGGVLAHGVAELLHRLDGVMQEHFLPLAEVRRGPVPVDALDMRDPDLRHLGHQAVDDAWLGVVRVNQDREREIGGISIGHGGILASCSFPASLPCRGAARTAQGFPVSKTFP